MHLSTLGWGRVQLDADAAELLLFGNAGRTGEPRELEPDGAVDAVVLSTLTVATARLLGQLLGGRAAMGAALAVSAGHGVWVARDAGSLVGGEPPTLSLRFPLLQGEPGALAGRGASLHLGGAWQRGRWSAGATLSNAVGRFRWSRVGMVLRPGEAVLGGDGGQDNSPRPPADAPSALLRRLDRLRPAAEATVAAAFDVRPGLRMAGQLRRRLEDGIARSPGTTALFGVEWLPTPVLPVHAGIELGSGLGLGVSTRARLGRWFVRGATGLRVGGTVPARSVELGVGVR